MQILQMTQHPKHNMDVGWSLFVFLVTKQLTSSVLDFPPVVNLAENIIGIIKVCFIA
jgi:hypothetical protein